MHMAPRVPQFLEVGGSVQIIRQRVLGHALCVELVGQGIYVFAK